ncbi:MULTISPECIES: TonB-dependent receptor [unclassified Azospirillum]|uniref:TonB-dependent receptor n=1 Tax=unclassified Azospirillum TaxID=2630922 RepID=UPI000B6ACA3E|nr:MULTISPECIES: TonB-dependent receptor [unclassified Azospirillum]SNR92981.1 iron complex outermembrane recepter protein [Azospirillum sp. RU38E]SNS08885.1 iron complex outermembrane recepter protein [Azospirillum sp. RU37A]
MRPLLPALALLATAIITPAALADAASVEEIIVTARMRAEDPQKVPASLIVLDAAILDRAGISSIASIASHAPGLVVSDPFGRFNPAPAMRGLSQPGTGDEPSVGFFLDGVYISGRSSINMFLADLARVEVLKGPQNALFGRNSFGGAVNLVTNPPGEETEGSLELTAGAKDRREATGAVSGALVPGKLSARLNVAHKEYGGFYKNSVADGPEIGSEQSTSAALTLRATPTDRLEATLRLLTARDRDDQPKGYYLATNCQPRAGTVALSQYCGEIPEYQGAFAANAQHTGFMRDAQRAALTARYSADAVEVTSITAIGQERNEFNRDDDYSAALLSRAGQLTKRWDGSQEIRLLSLDQGQALTWLLGGSLYRFDNSTWRRNIQYVQGQTSPSGVATDARTDSAALYGSATLRLGQGLAVTGDLRWQRDAKDFASTARNAAGQPIRLSDQWTLWTPRVQLSWQASDNLLAYVSAAKGMKSGGFNDMANLFDAERSFGPESNWTYEAGVKSVLADGRLTANAALFHIDWRRQQVVAASTAGLLNNFYTNNAGRSRSRGLELELTARPLEGLDLHGAYSFIDAEFRDYADPDYRDIPAFAAVGGQIGGLALPRQSRHQLALGADYRADLPLDDLAGFAGGEWLWQSRQYAENSNLSWVPADSKINLWTGLEKGAYRLTFKLQNLLDERNPLVAVRFSRPTAAGFTRAWLVTPADGRTWTLSLRARI